ncbi:MAG: hypothetical protein AAF586_06340 [Planctomycetota bacterium]
MRVAVLIEYHSYGAPVVGNTVKTQFASLYLAEDVDADDVFGHHHFADARFAKIVERGSVKDVEKLGDLLAEQLNKLGTHTQIGTFYDE